jgi:hypothetical protein
MNKQIYHTVAGLVSMGLGVAVCTAEMKPATFCRFVLERADDFAWENDKIAFRAYGPALKEKGEDSGFDAWLKRVEYPIIDKWYKENQEGKSYHTDHGEGYDPYKVGSSRGCGGLALWVDGKMIASNVFTEWKIIKSEPAESVFVLRYEYQVGEDRYTEDKQISIKRGDRLFKSTSTFKKNGQPAGNLPAVGMVLGKAGAKVCVNDLDEGKLASAKEEFAAAGIDIYTLVFNVTNEAEVDAGISKIEAEVGDIDILANFGYVKGENDM